MVKRSLGQESDSDSDDAPLSKHKRARRSYHDDVDSDEEEEQDIWDENLFIDEEDRLRLEAMKDVEMQTILAERHDIRERIRKRRELFAESKAIQEQKHKQQQHAKKKPLRKQRSKKRASYAQESDSDQAVPEEPESEDDEPVRESALQDSSDDDDSQIADDNDDDDVDDDDDDDYSQEQQRSSSHKKQQKSALRGRRSRSFKTLVEEEKKQTPITLESLKCVLLRRSNLEKVFDEPYFSSVVKGLFGRVFIGSDRGVPKYRVCEVLEVWEPQPEKFYKLGGKYTNKRLVVQHGKYKKPFHMEFFSNSTPSQREFDSWKAACQQASVTLLSTEEAKTRARNAENTRKTFTYTSENMNELKVSQRLTSRVTNVANPTIEAMELETTVEVWTAKVDKHNTLVEEMKLDQTPDTVEDVRDIFRERDKATRDRMIEELSMENDQQDTDTKILMASPRAYFDAKVDLGKMSDKLKRFQRRLAALQKLIKKKNDRMEQQKKRTNQANSINRAAYKKGMLLEQHAARFAKAKAAENPDDSDSDQGHDAFERVRTVSRVSLPSFAKTVKPKPEDNAPAEAPQEPAPVEPQPDTANNDSVGEAHADLDRPWRILMSAHDFDLDFDVHEALKKFQPTKDTATKTHTRRYVAKTQQASSHFNQVMSFDDYCTQLDQMVTT